MAISVSKGCVIVGLISLAHAAYSSAQHRSYLALTEQEFTQLPTDILLQSLVGLLLTIYGVVHIAGNFKEILASAELENKTWDALSNRASFLTFHHRGKALFGRPLTTNFHEDINFELEDEDDDSEDDDDSS